MSSNLSINLLAMSKTRRKSLFRRLRSDLRSIESMVSALKGLDEKKIDQQMLGFLNEQMGDAMLAISRARLSGALAVDELKQKDT